MTREETKNNHIEGWVNVFAIDKDGLYHHVRDFYKNREDADKAIYAHHRVACVRVTGEYEVKEPKPFDWLGKNIQWVRAIGNEHEIHAVREIVGHALSFCDGRYERVCGFDILKTDYEWSEDNATWRKFE